MLGLSRKQQADAAQQVAERGFRCAKRSGLVKRQLAQPRHRRRSRAPAPVDPDVQRLERDLSERLGASVEVQQGARGKGQLVIRYHSLDELEGILAHIR